jgi:hypothetical protein
MKDILSPSSSLYLNKQNKWEDIISVDRANDQTGQMTSPRWHDKCSIINQELGSRSTHPPVSCSPSLSRDQNIIESEHKRD